MEYNARTPTTKTVIYSIFAMIAISNELTLAEHLRVSPLSQSAYVGDHVTFDCLGNNGKIDFYIENRVAWTFTNAHGNTTILTYGFYPAPQLKDRFKNDKYELDYGTVMMSNEASWFRFRLNITAVYQSDSGIYTCSMMAANGSEISHGQVRLNVTVPVPTCEDDPQFHCSFVLGTFDVCADIAHAKAVCRQYCKLCDVVDGSWGEWTLWSECPVTCGVGNRTRTRPCDSPAPANGGDGCTGSNTETNISNVPCPDPNKPVVMSVLTSNISAHVGDRVALDCVGSNSDWTYYIGNRVSWIFKSLNGTETRNLTFGFHPTQELQSRFDDGQYELELVKLRVNRQDLPTFRLNINAAFITDSGTYTCSLTAENGTQISQAATSIDITVERPVCEDDPNFQCGMFLGTVNVCLDVHHAKLVCRKSCHLCNLADGVWGDWTFWSACHMTCGTGTRTRTRHCDSPAPANGGLDCTGGHTESTPCRLRPCPTKDYCEMDRNVCRLDGLLFK